MVTLKQLIDAVGKAYKVCTNRFSIFLYVCYYDNVAMGYIQFAHSFACNTADANSGIKKEKFQYLLQAKDDTFSL